MPRIKSDFIREKLTWLHSKVSTDNEQGLYDINKTCEDVFMHLLNSTYGWSLQNANLIQENFPAIDLIDKKNKIVIQVTSTTSTNKLSETIKKFRKLREYQHYQLKVFYIKTKPNFRQKILEDFAKEGVKQADLLCADDILEKVKSDITICAHVYETLEKIIDDNSHNVEKTAINIGGDSKGVANVGAGSEVNQTINNYYSNNNSQEKQTTSEYVEEQKIKKVKKALKKIDINLFKKIAYQYLPRSYFASLPNTSNEIIDHLLSIGALENCVPVLSIFEDIENKQHHRDIKAFIDYLKDIKYKEKSISCRKNKEALELSLLICFSPQDGENSFMIETWRYENGETYKISIDDNFSSINLKNRQQVAIFLDAINNYLKEIDLLINRNKVYIEIIIPNQILYNTIKQWRDTKGKRLIRRYKYLFTIKRATNF